MYGKEHYKEILFTDEKMFTVEETFNEQNNRVYARLSKKAHKLVLGIERGNYSASVMVWWGDITSLHFFVTRDLGLGLMGWSFLPNAPHILFPS